MSDKISVHVVDLFFFGLGLEREGGFEGGGFHGSCHDDFDEGILQVVEKLIKCNICYSHFGTRY